MPSECASKTEFNGGNLTLMRSRIAEIFKFDTEKGERYSKEKRSVNQLHRVKREAKEKRPFNQLPRAKREAKKKRPFHQLPRAKREA